ncbi:MAG: hypothetical protein HY907_12310 [Deltaproteobacteria bacterium]|nr:hypothetical protein [Deltaproteobacteria bacterium]
MRQADPVGVDEGVRAPQLGREVIGVEGEPRGSNVAGACRRPAIGERVDRPAASAQLPRRGCADVAEGSGDDGAGCQGRARIPATKRACQPPSHHRRAIESNRLPIGACPTWRRRPRAGRLGAVSRAWAMPAFVVAVATPARKAPGVRLPAAILAGLVVCFAEPAAADPAPEGPAFAARSLDAVSELHVRAETQQAGCDAGDAGTCETLVRLWDEVIAGYRFVLAEDPMGPHAYDCMFNLATALYFAGWEDEALAQYKAVEDSPLGTAHERDALANQITILESTFLADGQGLIPEEPPSHVDVAEDGTDRTIPDPLPAPPLIARWHAAMLRWVERYPDDPESLGYRRMIAGHLFFLGRWDEAERMFRGIFDDYCGNSAQGALELEMCPVLSTLAGYAVDRERIHFLRDAAEDAARFESGAPDGWPFPRDPCFVELGSVFEQPWHAYVDAREARDSDAFRETAALLLDAALRCPHLRDAPAAIRIAANAYGQAHEPVLAVETWKKLIEFCSPPSTHLGACEADGPDDPNRVRLAEAHFYVAVNAMQTYDLEEAVHSFSELEHAVGRSGRGATLRPVADCVGMAVNSCTDAEFLAESMRGQADIARLRADWAEAARVTERILNEDLMRSTEDAAGIRLDLVDFYRRASAWSDMRQAADEYLEEYDDDPDRRLDVLRVRWFLFEDAGRQGDERARERALRRLDAAFDKLTDDEKSVVGTDLEPEDAQLVLDVEDGLARSAFEALDAVFERFARLRFEPGDPTTLSADASEFQNDVVSQAKALTAGYETVIRSFPVAPTGGTAARYRIAAVWNHLAEMFATLEQRVRPEWLDLELPSGTTLRGPLEELAVGLRGVVVENGVTLEELIRRYLIGDSAESSGHVVGALTFARTLGASNRWVLRAAELARRLGFTTDPAVLFVNGPMPRITGTSPGFGLDTVAE